MGEASGVLFLRPTSGLTKYFGTWTSLFAVIGASLGTYQWLFVTALSDLYPGINSGLTWGIGMIFMLIFTVMLTLLSLAMPRSAGIYQISARGLNPVAGTLAVWRGIIANPIIKMSEFYLFLVFLGSAFTHWGAVAKNGFADSLRHVALYSKSHDPCNSVNFIDGNILIDCLPRPTFQG